MLSFTPHSYQAPIRKVFAGLATRNCAGELRLHKGRLERAVDRELGGDREVNIDGRGDARGVGMHRRNKLASEEQAGTRGTS